MQKKSLDLVAIGECLVEFAEISPRTYAQDYSGDVLNALWMASVLGLRTGLVTAFGDDPFTPGLQAILREASIDCSTVSVEERRPNGVYYVLDRDGRKVFHFLRKGSAATQSFGKDLDRLRTYLLSARAVLFSAIPLAVIEHRDAMIELLEDLHPESTIAFDTNVRRALWPDLSELRTLIVRLAPIIRVLFVSQDDDVALFGERGVREALEQYQSFGYRTVIYRRGSAPTVGLSKGDVVEVPTVPGVQVIDPTGAGDAFNAGFIAGLLRGDSLKLAMAFGNAAAASVLGTSGGRGIGVSREVVLKLASRIEQEQPA